MFLRNGPYIVGNYTFSALTVRCYHTLESNIIQTLISLPMTSKLPLT
jgi:hypothetical protein